MVERGELGPRRRTFRSREEVSGVAGISNQKESPRVEPRAFYLYVRKFA